MIFVDTGAWFALAVQNDPDHEEPDYPPSSGSRLLCKRVRAVLIDAARTTWELALSVLYLFLEAHYFLGRVIS